MQQAPYLLLLQLFNRKLQVQQVININVAKPELETAWSQLFSLTVILFYKTSVEILSFNIE